MSARSRAQAILRSQASPLRPSAARAALQMALEMAYVCSAVIPMGWINAVSLFQHLMRNLTLCEEPMGAAIPGNIEWRRDMPLPSAYAWVQCYLDDFDAPEIVSEKDASLHIGRPSAALVLRRLANARNGVAISVSKLWSVH